MSVQKHEVYYKMNHQKRGLAYIFNHQNFEKCDERHGTEQDANRLKITLEGLNFEVHVFTDLDKIEVMDEVNKG